MQASPVATGDAGDAQALLLESAPSEAKQFDEATHSDASTEPGDAETEDRHRSTKPNPKREATHSDAYFSLTDTPLTVPEALSHLQQHSFRLGKRALQRWCREGCHGLACRKVSTTTGQEWHISKRSLDTLMSNDPDQFIPTNEATHSDAHPREASHQAAPQPATAIGEPKVEPNDEATHSDASASRGVADGERDLFERIIRQQGEQIDFLQSELAKRDNKEIVTISTRMLETLEAIAAGRRLPAPPRNTGEGEPARAHAVDPD